AQEGCGLFHKKQYAAAEPLLRQYLESWNRHHDIFRGIHLKDGDSWSPHHVKVLLGRCLAGQKKYGEAEPVLLAGLEETWRLYGQFPLRLPPSPFHRDFDLPEVWDQVAQFYQERGMPEKAAAWRPRRPNPSFLRNPDDLPASGKNQAFAR